MSEGKYRIFRLMIDLACAILGHRPVSIGPPEPHIDEVLNIRRCLRCGEVWTDAGPVLLANPPQRTGP